MSRLPTTSYAILGLLSRGPKSGYELAGLADRTIAHFWSIAKSQVYGELVRLERLGYVRGTDVQQRKIPDKRVFRLTARGESALDAWLSEADSTPDRYRSAFLVKVFFGDRIPSAVLDEHFEHYHVGVRRYHDQLAAIVTQTAGQPKVAHRRATALLGMRLTEAVDAWVRSVRADLVHSGRSPESHDPRSPAARLARHVSPTAKRR